jgi:spermidine/putrescine transport system ATP-binding protein
MGFQEYDVVLDSVNKTFDKVVAVDQVSLKVRKGTFVTLLGPSGCGKTTTLRIIGGFEQPDSGKVYLKGCDVTGIPPYKRETNLVFQDFALFPHMNILNNIGFGLRMKGVAKRRIRQKVLEMLEMVELPEVIHRKPNQLSGGQRQRVALCRSLILEPAVLLLDEPLGALDAMIRKQMQSELKNLQKKLGQTFISVTHDQEEALTMSDEIAIMKDGRIQQIGSPHEVYEHPVSRFVATFLGDCNLLEMEIVDVQPQVVVAAAPDLGMFYVHSPNEGQGQPRQKQVSLMVRPENITIVRDNGAHENRLEGVIKQSAFKGSTTEYLVQAQRTEIRLQIPGKSEYRSGEKVALTWRKEDCYLIPQDH